MYRRNAVLAVLLIYASPILAWGGIQAFPPPASSSLVLEITYRKGQPPSVQTPGSAAGQPTKGWSTAFVKLQQGRGDARGLPIYAVQVSSQLQANGSVRIWVAVRRGESGLDSEEPVAEFSLVEDQLLTVAELTRFGIEPIELRVRRLAFTGAVLPQIANDTQSLAVTRITSISAATPTFRVDFKNNSAKPIAAFAWDVRLEGRMMVSALPFGQEARVLIPAGGTYALSVPARYQSSTPGVPSRDLSREHEFVVKAVVFQDGSYEGSTDEASEFRSFLWGRRMEAPRILDVFAGFLESAEPNELSVLRFKAQLLALSTEIEEAGFDALVREFPQEDKTRLDSRVRIASAGVKQRLITDFNNFEKDQVGGLSFNALREWVAKESEKFEAFFARLSE